MSGYKFVPNNFAKKRFNLTGEYNGEGMTPLLQQALGKDNYDRYVITQTPLYQGKDKGVVEVMLNPDETKMSKMKYRSIGTIWALD